MFPIHFCSLNAFHFLEAKKVFEEEQAAQAAAEAQTKKGSKSTKQAAKAAAAEPPPEPKSPPVTALYLGVCSYFVSDNLGLLVFSTGQSSQIHFRLLLNGHFR